MATEIRLGSGLNAAAMLILISVAENEAAGQVWPFDGFLQKLIDGVGSGRLTSHAPCGDVGTVAGRRRVELTRSDRRIIAKVSFEIVAIQALSPAG
jgi:hypothetical protein